jgi:hypothetical protein
MGTPIPPERKPNPVPAGDDCDICWGVGKPLGGGPPPSEVIATFFGIEKGPDWEPGDGEPLAGDYTLTQDSIDPCYFLFDNDPEWIVWSCTSEYSELWHFNSVGPDSFDQWGTPCQVFFENIEFRWFINGSGKITLPGIEE